MDQESIQPTPAPVEPISPQPVPSPRSFNPFLILVVIVLLTLVGAGGVFLGKSLNTSQPSAQPTITPLPTQIPTPIPDETANWKTFIGNKVQFKYPSSWTPVERGSFGGAVYDNIFLGIPTVTSDQSLGFSSVTFENLTNNKPNDIDQETTISIGGQSGVEWLRKGDNYTAYGFYTKGFLEAGSFGLHVVVGKKGDQQIYDQLKTLISTIKFTSP